MPGRAIAATLAVAISLAAGWGSSHRPSRPDEGARAAAARVAAAYYDAFRRARLDEACRYVAPRLLDTLPPLVGVNERDGRPAAVAAPRDAPVAGCPAAKRRRQGWSEPIPRSDWRVEDIYVDRDGERARVDTSAEGTYWMRRTREGWKIVAFGSLSPRGVAQIGGEWPRDPFNPHGAP